MIDADVTFSPRARVSVDLLLEAGCDLAVVPNGNDECYVAAWAATRDDVMDLLQALLFGPRFKQLRSNMRVAIIQPDEDGGWLLGFPALTGRYVE